MLVSLRSEKIEKCSESIGIKLVLFFLSSFLISGHPHTIASLFAIAINFVRFIAYSISAVVIRKSWNWLTADVDPIPGSKEFDQEWSDTMKKVHRLRKRKEQYEKNRKSR